MKMRDENNRECGCEGFYDDLHEPTMLTITKVCEYHNHQISSGLRRQISVGYKSSAEHAMKLLKDDTQYIICPHGCNFEYCQMCDGKKK